MQHSSGQRLIDIGRQCPIPKPHAVSAVSDMLSHDMLCSMRVLATPQVAGAHLHDTEKPSNQVNNHLYQYAVST